MKLKSLFNFFSNTFLFGIILLCLVGISSSAVNAQRLTISKDFCDSVGAQNTCNGNKKFQEPAGTVQFTVTAVDPTTGAAIGATQTVDVVIGNQGFSSGTTSGIDLLPNTTFDVCEIVPDGFEQAPRPDSSTGGINQTTPPGKPNCIRFTTSNSNGNVDTKFINLAQAPTAASAMVSGRIKDVNGKYISRVNVTLTQLSTGATFTTSTNFFGRYVFEDLPTAEQYIVAVSSKRYVFTPETKVISLMQDLTATDFIASWTGNLLQSNR